MISPLVRHCVTGKAKKIAQTLPDNYAGMLEHIAAENSTPKVRVGYSWIMNGNADFLNASTAIPGHILVNTGWAKALVLEQDDDMVLAFRNMIGHELAHHEYGDFVDALSALYPYSEGRFINWVAEVHADFYGIAKKLDGIADQGIRAMKVNLRHKVGDEDSRTHPSWARRIEFVEKYDFNEKLVRHIADLTGCTDEELIEDIVSYFFPITLIR